MDVTLLPFEGRIAATAAIERKLDSIANDRGGVIGGRKAEDWAYEIEGACAEVAAAKVLDKFWNGSVNTFKSMGDVGDYEVRHTVKPNGRLIVRPKDDGKSIYVFVRGFYPNYEVVGWIKGEDAMNKKYMRNPGGLGVAFFVPEEALNPIEELLEKEE